jgi:RND family efflux transporter MFP subunit
MWIFLLVAGLLGGGVGYFQHRSNEKMQAALDKRKRKVERKDIKKELVLTGKVLPSSSVAVYAPVSGQLKEIFVAEGASVQKDQPLFSVIQDTSGQSAYETAQTEFERARLELQVADQNARRRVSVKDLFSDVENQKIEEDLARKQLEYDASRQRLQLLKETLGLTSDKLAKRAPRDRTIFVKAPKAGVVTFVNKSVGENVLATSESAEATGREVLTLSDLEKMIVRSRILESDLASVKVGSPVKVKLDAFREKEYAGKVSRISQQGIEDRQAGYTYFVTDVLFERPDDDVRAQMNATLTLTLAEKKNALTLPAVAVATLGGNSVVEVVPEKANETKYRRIQVGIATESLVEITDPAIKEGEEFLEIDFSKLDLKALSQGKLGENDKLTQRQP